MANAVVQLPVGYFPDPSKGRPLWNAKIYVGTIDLDPRTSANQKVVTGRQENGTEVALAQPVRTNSGGVPVDGAGNVVTLLVDGAYAMAVDDKNDNQKYYFADVLDGEPLSFDTVGVYTGLVFANIDDAKNGILLNGLTVSQDVGEKATTLGYYSSGDGGGGNYVVVSPSTGSDDGGSYHDMNNGNQLELQHNGNIKAKWFGVRGDCSLLFSSGLTPSGTDDTDRLLAARTYVQESSVFNYARGISNEFTLSFDPEMKIRVTGDNVMGTTLPRLTSSSSGADKLVRCNYRVEGNGCIFYWKTDADTDRFIESHESLVRQHYKDFTIVQSDMTLGDISGVIYSNIANDSANATSWHKFDNVTIDLAGTGYVAAPDTGYYRVFQYEGNNLGDKLITDNCSFRYFQTAFHSTNLEAVGQKITKTGFYAYMDNAIFFHIIEHGSSFTVENCDLLIKGNDQTLLKIEKQNPSGVFGSSAIFNFNNNRTETDDGKTCTFVSANSGVINYSDGISTAGGLPNPESILFYAYENAVINVNSCVIAGRIATGDYSDPLLTISRNYGIKLDACHLIVDPAESVGVYDGTTFTPSYNIASTDIKTKPIFITNSNNNTCNWQGGVGDNVKRILDFTYNTYSESQFRDVYSRVTLFSVRGSTGFRFPQILPDTDLTVVPASSVIDSIVVSYYNIFSEIDTLRVTIGSATQSLTVDASSNYRSSFEMMPDNIIICPSSDTAERTVVVSATKGGVDVTTSIRAAVTLTIRPCYSYLDNTSLNEDGTTFKLSKTRT